MKEQTTEKAIVLFDGICNFCNQTINWVIDHDPGHRIRFAAQQSESGKRLLQRYQIPVSEDTADTVIVIWQGKSYQKSEAAILILELIGWKWTSGFLRLIPLIIRNLGYTWIARNRYRWFGKRDSCRMPTPDLRSRFLND